MSEPPQRPTERLQEPESPGQYGLGTLFLSTTIFALGLALTVGPFPEGINGMGLSLVLFQTARAAFFLSRQAPRFVQEILFLLGLPAYLASMLVMVWSCLWFAMLAAEMVTHMGR